MQSLTIQQAADATGWSQRMLRYLEQAGLVAALRTPGGHRHYGPRQIERLQKLRELIDAHGLGITDIAFELRMRTDPQVARAVDDWFGPIHRFAAPPGAGIYRRLAAPDQQDYPHDHPAVPSSQGEHVSITLTADSAGSVSDFKVADLSLAGFGRKEIQLAEHEMPGLMALRREFGPSQPLKGKKVAGSSRR
jgi:adenosylhomocysteinase